MKFVSAALIGVCALLAIYVGIARATAGGASIASALVATPGVQEDGNTSFPDNCQNNFEFWTLHLTQGDLVEITWSAPPAVDRVALWPAGTSDADNNGCLYASGWSHWAPVVPVLEDTSGSAQTFVTKTGSYPLLFLDTTGANAGAISFTAVVRHAATVALPHVSRIPASGTLTASVRAPDTSPINDSSLRLTLNGFWSSRAGAAPRAHKLATATPTNGMATFDYNLPSTLWGKKIRLAISGGGSSYQDVTTPEEPVKVLVSTGAPVLVPSSALMTASKLLRQPIYWAGPRKGFHYEFTRTTADNIFVRYLPHGVHPGDPRAKFRIVATYPYRGAYAALKKYANGKAVAGPHGSIYFVLPVDPRSVYVAFPKLNYEIEVFDPSPAVARKIAATGSVIPVR